MNTSAEAERIKWSYLEELEVLLQHVDPIERTEMIQGIIEHIYESAEQESNELIDGQMMQSILTKIGSPEEIADQLKEKETQRHDAQANEMPKTMDEKVWLYVGIKNLIAVLIAAIIGVVIVGLITRDLSVSIISGCLNGALIFGIFRASYEGFHKGIRNTTMESIKRNFYAEIFPT